MSVIRVIIVGAVACAACAEAASPAGVATPNDAAMVLSSPDVGSPRVSDAQVGVAIDANAQEADTKVGPAAADADADAVVADADADTDADHAPDVGQVGAPVEAAADGPALVCPGISSFQSSPAELVGSQLGTIMVKTLGPTPTGFIWMVGSCPCPTGTLSGGVVGGFITASGIAIPSGSVSTSSEVQFSCGSCKAGPVTVSVQVLGGVSEAGGDSGASDVCKDAPFTKVAGLINCQGALCPVGNTPCPVTMCPTICVDLSSDDKNCGACGKACVAPLTCQGGKCS